VTRDADRAYQGGRSALVRDRRCQGVAGGGYSLATPQEEEFTMSASEPNNTEAIRQSLALLDQFEESLGQVAIEDWTCRGIERNMKELRHALESELRKLESELLQAFTGKTAKDEYVGRGSYTQ
jgi:hypothetical protein